MRGLTIGPLLPVFNALCGHRGYSVYQGTLDPPSLPLPCARPYSFTEIGVALTGLGFLFLFIGVLFFFDRGLLAMGNVRQLRRLLLSLTTAAVLLPQLPQPLRAFCPADRLSACLPSSCFSWQVWH